MARVDNRDFVVAWMTSETLDDVVKATGMTKPGVQYKAKTLRDKGVKLPKLKRQTLGDLEIAQLNSLVNKYKKERILSRA